MNVSDKAWEIRNIESIVLFRDITWLIQLITSAFFILLHRLPAFPYLLAVNGARRFWRPSPERCLSHRRFTVFEMYRCLLVLSRHDSFHRFHTLNSSTILECHITGMTPAFPQVTVTALAHRVGTTILFFPTYVICTRIMRTLSQQ